MFKLVITKRHFLFSSFSFYTELLFVKALAPFAAFNRQFVSTNVRKAFELHVELMQGT